MADGMEKTILKTAAFTAAVLITVFALISAGAALFAPAYASDVCNRLGAGRLAVSLSVRAYGKSGDINDLHALVERSSRFGRHDITSAYAAELLAHSDFDAFAAHKDGQSDEDVLAVMGGYRVEVECRLTEAYFAQGKYIKALGTAQASVNRFGQAYPQLSAMDIFIAELASSQQAKAHAELSGLLLSFLKDIKLAQYYNEDTGELVSEGALHSATAVCAHLFAAHTALGNEGEAEHYRAIYNALNQN